MRSFTYLGEPAGCGKAACTTINLIPRANDHQSRFTYVTHPDANCLIRTLSQVVHSKQSAVDSHGSPELGLNAALAFVSFLSLAAFGLFFSDIVSHLLQFCSVPKQKRSLSSFCLFIGDLLLLFFPPKKHRSSTKA